MRDSELDRWHHDSPLARDEMTRHRYRCLFYCSYVSATDMVAVINALHVHMNI